MKLFEIPVLVVSLFGVCFLSSVAAPPAQADFTFGVPEPASPLRYNEWFNCLSYDGLEMYTEAPGVTDQQGTFDLWVRKRASKNEDWGPVENLGPLVNSASADYGACISSDGLTLYFVAQDRPDGYGGSDIYATTRETKEDPWGPAVNLGPTINSSSSNRMVWISADNLELYFGSNRPGGSGASDIYVASRATTNAPWGAPVNLGPVVNTPYGECYVSLSPDGLLLVFSEWYTTTNVRPGGHGAPDIWMTRRTSLSAPWQTPVNLGTPVNGPTNDFSPSISSDGHTLYFSSLDREGGGVFQAPIIPIVDFNGDGQVDEKDLLLMTKHWGQNYPGCDIGPFAWGDGVVDGQDFVVFMEAMEGRDFILSPRPNTSEVPLDVILTWTLPQFTGACDVYFGTSFADVNNADRADPCGVLVSQGQEATTYDPDGLLEFGRTYYWRIDFVTAGPAATIYKGPVLEFTTESFARPIKNVMATASSAAAANGPEKTADGSGLDKNGGHSTSPTDMWLSTGSLPNWICFEFDKVYTLQELWVWNSNWAAEPLMGFGARNVKAEYSVDGTAWTLLEGVPEFAQAPGTAGYKANTIVNFGGVSTRYVKLTIEKNWGVTPSVGLSEVRFFYIPDRPAPQP